MDIEEQNKAAERAELIDTLRMAFNGLVDIQNRLPQLSAENLISELEVVKMWLAGKLTDDKPRQENISNRAD
jgi:hypothetical protein